MESLGRLGTVDDPRQDVVYRFSRQLLETTRVSDALYQEALERCSTEQAPWFAIPADQKWYRNVAIARILVATLERLDPQFPAAEEGLDEIEVV